MSDVETVAKFLGVKLEGLSGKAKFKAVTDAKAASAHKDKSVSELAGWIKTEAEAKKSKPDAKVEPKAEAVVAAVKSEAASVPQNVNFTSPGHKVDVGSPVIHMNVPAPIVNVGHAEAPKWWNVAEGIHRAALHVVLGAAIWALFGQKVIMVAKLGGM